jgi:chemotaxis protein CheD
MTAERDFVVRRGLFTPHPQSVEVGVAGISVAKHPARLMTPALGSCVGVALWDPLLHIGALAHVMLPATGDGTPSLTAKYAEFAVPEMVRQIIEAGALRRRVLAKIAGGAAMFTRESGMASIGDRNVEEVKRQLALQQIGIISEDTGQGHARTIELILDTGILLVHSHRYGTREI